LGLTPTAALRIANDYIRISLWQQISIILCG
jgi:hypothetical protein